MSAPDSATDFNSLSNLKAVTAFDLLDGNTYALASGDSSRISLLSVREGGSLAIETTVENGANGFNALRDIGDMVSFTLHNGSTYALAAMFDGHGVQLIRVHENGTVTGADSLAGPDDGFTGSGNRGVTSVDAFEMDGDTYALAAWRGNLGDSTVHLIRVHENGTLERVDTYYHRWLLIPGDITAFTLRDGSTHAAVSFMTNNALYMFDMTLPAPSLLYISSAYADGSYGHEADINITAVFDGRVYVNASSLPELQTSTGRNATYLSGNGTTALTFRYDVEPGDPVRVLDQAGTDLGGALANYLGVQANDTLPAEGSGNTLGERKRLAADGIAPFVVSVSSPYDDTYGPHAITDPGAIVPIAVAFDEAVAIYEGEGGGAVPTLELAIGEETNGEAVYASGNGSSTLVFEYVVRDGDRTDDLDYAGAGALSLSGGSIRDGVGNALGALAALPNPGTAGSLGASEAIMIDTSLSPPPSTLRPVMSSTEAFYRASTTESPHGVDAFTLLNGSTYVIMTSEANSAVHLLRIREDATFDLADSASQGDPGIDALSDSGHVDAFRLRNGSTYAMVSSELDNSVQLIRVHEDGTLSGAGSLRHGQSADLALNQPERVHVFTLSSGDTYAMVAARGDGDVQLIRVHEDGRMAGVGTLRNNVTYAQGASLAGSLLMDARAAVTFTLGGGEMYSLAGGNAGGGVLGYRVQGDGAFAFEASALDGSGGFEELDGSNDMVAFALRNGSRYVLSASFEDAGVQVIRVREDGGGGAIALGAGGHASDNTTGSGVTFEDVFGSPRLTGTRAVDAFALDGDTYALVASDGNAIGRYAAVQLLRVHEDGTLEEISFITHRQPTNWHYAGPRDVAAFTLRDGRTYAAVPAFSNDFVGLFELTLPAPSVLRVASAGGNGTYHASVDISVVFDGRVYASAADLPELRTSTGRSAAYHSGNGTTALTFRYEVAPNEEAVLDQAGADLGGTVANYLGAAANTTLPARGSGNTLGEQNRVEVDGTVPVVTSVSSTAANGTYAIGSTIPITVTFGKEVTVAYADGARPYIVLETGENDRRAYYGAGSGGRTLVFEYTV